MNNKQILKMSDYIYKDIFTESAIQEAGANSAKIMENLEKNANALNSQSKFMKIVFFVYLLFTFVFPLSILAKVEQAITGGIDPMWALTVGTLGFFIFFVLQLALLVMFQIFLFKYVVSGDSFKWLSTFPIARKDLEKSIFFTIFKSMDWGIYATLLILPVSMVIITKNPVIVAVSVFFTIINLFFAISILINFSRKVNQIFKLSGSKDKKATLTRVLILVLYYAIIIFSVLTLQFVPGAIDNAIASNPTSLLMETIEILVILPIPISPSFLLIYLETGIGSQFVIYAVIGLILWTILGIAWFSKTIKNLPNIIKDQGIGGDVEEKIEVLYSRTSSIKAFIRKDLNSLARDIQMIIYFTIPVMYGIIGIFFIDDEMRFTTTSFTYLGISIIFLVLAISRLDSDGATFLASVPYHVKDQFMARLWWFPIILIPGFLFPMLFLTNHPHYQDLLLSTLVWVWWGPLLGILGLEIKVLMFGRTKHKFIMEEVSKKNTVLKWLVFGIIIFGITIGLMIAFFETLEQSNFNGYLRFNLIGFAVCGLIDLILFKLLFPTPKQ